MRHLLLCRPDADVVIDVGAFFSPWRYDGSVRCDLHPRWSPDGRWVRSIRRTKASATRTRSTSADCSARAAAIEVSRCWRARKSLHLGPGRRARVEDEKMSRVYQRWIGSSFAERAPHERRRGYTSLSDVRRDAGRHAARRPTRWHALPDCPLRTLSVRLCRESPGADVEPVQEEPAAVPERARHRRSNGSAAASCRRPQARAVWSRSARAGAGSRRSSLGDQRYRYVGFEPSASRAAFCRARGFDVREELFRGPDSVGMPADAIIIDNVLEHVEHPAALARVAVDALRPGGLSSS